MARKMYESADTLSHEQRCFRIIEKNWECKVSKIPISYAVDVAAEREGRIVAWIEFKGRKIKLRQYPDIMLSVLKYNHGKQLSKSTGVPFFFVVAFIDGLYYVRLDDIDPNSLGMKVGGRTKQTRDSADIEPVIHIDNGLFKRLIAKKSGAKAASKEQVKE